ncbi:hypothetical protein [Pseudarthrobacter raffinosi]|nr:MULTISPECIES: hypothetical protein [unclassified Pseudarthrobacter]MCO4239260.1 hypothetical protein [Pseudarthrobacter sp. MDT3-28]MCO4262956.1 hypothetical protein [Pseudarthrobacter sp. MDT3-26]
MTGSGLKAAVLCTAVVLFGTLTLPAQAASMPQARLWTSALCGGSF